MRINLLLDKLPQCTESGLRIRTDFRESIKFELLMQDNKISSEDKIRCALELYYYDVTKIKDFKKAVQEILWFYSGGEIKKEKTKNENQDNNENKKQIYSYEFDDRYIYNAFMQQYNIDLNKIKYLHWWKFRSLLDGLNENTQFAKILSYRSTNTSKIKDKSTREFYEKMKNEYSLPDMRTDEEKEADFANELW